MKFKKLLNRGRLAKTLIGASSLLFMLISFQNCGKTGGSVAVSNSSLAASGNPVAQDMIDIPGDEIVPPINDAMSSHERLGQLPSSLTTSAIAACTTSNQISNSATNVDTIYTFACPDAKFEGSTEIQALTTATGKTVQVSKTYEEVLANGEIVSGSRNVTFILDSSGNPVSATSQFQRHGKSTKLDYTWTGTTSVLFIGNNGDVTATGSLQLTDHGKNLGNFTFTSTNAIYDSSSGLTTGSFSLWNDDQTQAYSVWTTGSNKWHVQLNGETVQPSGI
jgi:hypothetical protein